MTRVSNAIRAHVVSLGQRKDLWDRFPVGIALWQEPGRLAYVNPTLVNWLERRADELVGATAEELAKLGVDGLITQFGWDQVRSGRYETPLVNRVQTPSGVVRFLETHLFRCLDRGDRFTGAFHIVLDRTHRYVAERNARLAAAGELAAAIAHEMKNHLAAAMGYLDLTERFVDGRGQPHLRQLRRQLNALNEHAQRLLVSARRSEGGRQRVDLEQVLVSAVATVTPYAAARGVFLDVGLPAQDASLEADPTRLEQVFVNLLLNAVDASLPGKAVGISVEWTPRGIEVIIRDQGTGMSAEVLRRVGEPFFTTKEEGSGLGVFLCREILADHGGQLDYESQPGSGTVARVVLPAARALPQGELGA